MSVEKKKKKKKETPLRDYYGAYLHDLSQLGPAVEQLDERDELALAERIEANRNSIYRTILLNPAAIAEVLKHLDRCADGKLKAGSVLTLDRVSEEDAKSNLIQRLPLIRSAFDELQGPLAGQLLNGSRASLLEPICSELERLQVTLDVIEVAFDAVLTRFESATKPDSTVADCAFQASFGLPFANLRAGGTRSSAVRGAI